MASRNREKRQKRRRKKKMKASVRNGLVAALCVILFGSYIAYTAYNKVGREELFGDVDSSGDIAEDDGFVITDGMVSYTVFSVGEGEAILLKNKSVEALIDTGRKDGAADLVKKLQGKINGELEYLVLTSPAEGRVGGLEEICKNFDIKTCIVGEMAEQEKYVWRCISGVGKVVNGDNLSYDIGDAATLFVIKPEVSSEDPRDRSLATYFTFGQNGFLALSDAGKEEVSRVFGNVTSVNVLVPPRYGSRDISGVIPDNRYEYIAVSNTSKCEAAKGSLEEVLSGTLYVTGVVGDLEFVSDGSKVTLSGEEKIEERLDAIDDKKKDAEKEALEKAREEEANKEPEPEIQGIPADEEAAAREKADSDKPNP